MPNKATQTMNTLLGEPETLTFGSLLRRWRTARRLSQLNLACEAGISARHLSFLETGRARPSREMVALLAEMLDVPLSERNALLIGAGYAPVYGERPLSAPELAHVRRALEYTLRQHEPYPALVLSAHHDIVMRNEGSRRLFELFRGPIPEGFTINGIRSIFDPRGIRPFIVNWDEMAECAMRGLQREIGATGDPKLVRLRDDVLAYPDVPTRFAALSEIDAATPVINMHLRKGEVSLRFFSAMTFIGRARDITLQHLKIECFFPGDDATDQYMRRLAAMPSAVAV